MKKTLYIIIPILLVLCLVGLLLFSSSLNPDLKQSIDKFPENPQYKEFFVYEVTEGVLVSETNNLVEEDRLNRASILFDSDQRMLSWEYIKKIYPIRYLNKINKLTLFNDGFGGEIINLSMKSFSENEREEWALAFDPEDMYAIIEGVGQVDIDAILYELGHLISIDSNQVDFDEELIASEGENYSKLFIHKQNECKTYLVQEGCLREDSYIFKLYEMYWKGEIFDEYSRIQSIEDREEFNQEMENFEKKYTDHFVTYIAALSPESDFAETLKFYLLDYPVVGMVRENKIRFISEFPELAKLKAEVLNNLKLLEKEDGSFN